MIETWTLLKSFHSIANNGPARYADRIGNVHIAAASEIVTAHHQHHRKNITHRFYDGYGMKKKKLPFSFFYDNIFVGIPGVLYTIVKYFPDETVPPPSGRRDNRK